MDCAERECTDTDSYKEQLKIVKDPKGTGAVFHSINYGDYDECGCSDTDFCKEHEHEYEEWLMMYDAIFYDLREDSDGQVREDQAVQARS